MPGIFDPSEVLWGMGSQQLNFIGCDRVAPFPIRMLIFQERLSACNALRSLGVPRTGIFQAACVMKNDHLKL